MGSLIEGTTDLLFGDVQEASKNMANDTLYAVKTPGMSLNPAEKQWSLTRSPELQNTINSLGNVFGQQAIDFAALRPLVEPGFGRLTEAGVKAIRDARRSTLGDLRKNLSRRRVLGSSFAQDDINRTTAEFQKREDEFRATTFLQEMQASADLISKQYAAQAQEFLTYLNQFNLESGLATQMATGVTAVLGANSQLAQSLAQASQQSFLSGAFGLGGIGLYNSTLPQGSSSISPAPAGTGSGYDAGPNNGANLFQPPQGW